VSASNSAYNSIVRKHLSKAISDILESVGRKNLRKFCLYISFDRSHKNVVFPDHITQERYVTIIIQNRFWDLAIDRENRGFWIVLDFEEREKIYVPFSSIVMFSDPENNFCLDFRDIESYDDESEDNIIHVDFKASN
jgi:hypothetical protein